MHWQCWLVGGALQMTENDAGMQWRYCFSLESLLLVFAFAWKSISVVATLYTNDKHNTILLCFFCF
jgi:hypothetical protein